MKKYLFVLLIVLVLFANRSASQAPAVALVACKSVDDNWNAIDVTSKIKAGECITLYFKSEQKITNTFMMWSIYKVEANGDESYVNDLMQSSDVDEWRKMYSEFCDVFTSPGKYRIYFNNKNEYDSHHGGNNPNALAKLDLTVE